MNAVEKALQDTAAVLECNACRIRQSSISAAHGSLNAAAKKAARHDTERNIAAAKHAKAELQRMRDQAKEHLLYDHAMVLP